MVMRFKESFIVSLGLLFIILFLTHSSKAASVDIIQNGVSGSITSDIEVDNLLESNSTIYIFFGTQLGVYIFSSNGSLENFIQTGSSVTNVKSIPDINENNYREIVATTANTYFPNVLCFDSLTGEKLWEFSSETEVFDIDMLWTMKQTNVYDLEISDSGDRIYLTAGYRIYCIDSETGEEINSYESSDNMWDIVLMDGDVIVGDQNGYVYRFTGDLDNIVWSKLVSKYYSVVNPSTKQVVGKVKRSVWDIIPVTIDGSDKLAVCSEDGYVYILDFETGDILNSVEIIEYVDELLYSYYGDYPLPTSSLNYNFFNLRARKISDVTGDGNLEILVYTYPGRRLGEEYQGAQEGIYIIDPSTCNIISKNENIELSIVNKIETFNVKSPRNETYILLPIGKSGSNEKIKLIYPKNCTTFKTLSINSTSRSYGFNNYFVKDLGGGNFLFISNYGDVMRLDSNGEVIWDYPRLNNIKVDVVDVTGSNEEDLLVYSTEGLNEEDFLEESSSRVIFVVDGETEKVAWKYEMPYEEYLLTGGLRGIKVTHDLNGDGKMDIIAYKQCFADWGSGDEYGEYTRIVVFSGNNGDIIYEKPLTNATYYGRWETIYNNPHFMKSLGSKEFEEMENHRIRKIITSLDTISDITGDGIPDFIAGSWKEVYILDSTSGEIVWTRTYDARLYESPFGENPMEEFQWNWTKSDRMRYFSLGDVNQDGYDELLMVSWNDMWILNSVISNGYLDYSPKIEISYDDGDIDRDRVKVIQDANGDNISDIIFKKHIKDSPSVYEIISGKDGSEILELEKDGTSFSIAASDFNSDNSNDSIIFYAHSNSGPKLEIINGRNDEVIWSYQGIKETWMIRDILGIQTIMPACSIDDINGDGIDELAIGRSLPWDEGAEVLIYDVYNDELLKTINIEPFDSTLDVSNIRWQPAIFAKRLSDLTGDAIDEIALIMALGEGNQKQLKLVIVDLIRGEVISDFIAKGTDIVGLGDNIVTYGGSGELYLLKIGGGINISSPSDNEVVSSPVEIIWSEDANETIKIIMVDNRKIAKTFEEKAEIDLKKGVRKITVYSIDRYGKGSYVSVEVIVEKKSAALIPLTIASTIFLIVLFLPKVYPILYRRFSNQKKLVTSREGDFK